MTLTLAHGYSTESTQWELSNEYQHDRVLDGFQKYLPPCPLDESPYITFIGKIILHAQTFTTIGHLS